MQFPITYSTFTVPTGAGSGTSRIVLLPNGDLISYFIDPDNPDNSRFVMLSEGRVLWGGLDADNQPIFAFSAGSSYEMGGILAFNSGNTDTLFVNAQLRLQPGDGVNPSAFFQSSNQSHPLDVLWTGSGIWFSPITHARETDHAPVLGTGWATAASTGTYEPITYRRGITDNLKIDGVVHMTSATPATTVFTLPVGYRPPNAVRVDVAAFSSANAIQGPAHIVIGSNGVVTLPSATALAVGNNFGVSIDIPLRDIP